MDLLRGVKERVYPVGRLDYHSEGLLLLTNDGELANAIMSAATHVPKTYLVKVNGPLTAEQEQQFRDGVPLNGRRTLPAGLKADPQRRESLVRSEADRRPQESDPHDVQAFRAAGGEAEARDDRPARTGSAEAGRVPAPDAEEEVAKLKRAVAALQRCESRMNQIARNASQRPAPSPWWGSRASASAPATASRSTCRRRLPDHPGESGRDAKCWARNAIRDLDSIPEPVDIVDIFRRSEFVPEIVEAAIRKGAKAIWMQEGVIHEDAAARARRRRPDGGDGPLHSEGPSAAFGLALTCISPSTDN